MLSKQAEMLWGIFLLRPTNRGLNLRLFGAQRHGGSHYITAFLNQLSESAERQRRHRFLAWLCREGATEVAKLLSGHESLGCKASVVDTAGHSVGWQGASGKPGAASAQLGWPSRDVLRDL